MVRRQTPRLYPVALPSPAAGAELSLTPTGLGGWLVQSLRWTLTTSAAVGNRTPRLDVTDGTSTLIQLDVPAVIAPSTAVRYQAFEGAFPSVGAGGLVTLSWPVRGVWLAQGYNIRSATAGLDVADQYSSIVAYVLEIPSGSEWYGFPMQLIHVESSDE